MKTKAIGIDIGTTSICGICIDAQTGAVIQSITIPNDTFIPACHNWEKTQDPMGIYTKALNLLDQLLDQPMCDDVRSIGVSGQMHGILYLDRNGNSISPLYTWEDMRGSLPYRHTTYADFIGCPSGYGHVTHFYNDINHLVPADMRYFCTIGDFFALRICHRKSPLMHSSNAASLGLFDVLGNRFSGDFCGGLSDDFFGEVTNDCAILGEYRNIPVSVAFGDNQASFMGAGGADGRIVVNIGTGSQITVMAPDEEHLRLTQLARKACMARMTRMELRPYMRDTYLLVGAALCGGRAYALLKDFFRDVHRMLTGVDHPDIYACMERELLRDDGTGLTTDLVVNTRFAGSRQNPMERGSIHQIGVSQFTPRDFMIGLLYGIANELYDLYKDSQITATELIASGNGIRKNKALQQILGHVFQMEPRISNGIEEAATGAALFSLLSVQ